MINDTATGSVSFMNVGQVIFGLLHVGMFYFVTVLNLLTFVFVCLTGCFCVYGSEESLEFVRDCLDELSVKSKYDTVDESNPILIPPPTFLILAKNPNNEEIVHQLRKEGQELCARYSMGMFYFLFISLLTLQPYNK